MERLQNRNTEKEIFLEIECFFEIDEFYTRDQVESIVDARGSSAKIVINVLIEKSLITIDGDNRISMHNLLQEMGQVIVRDEHKLPGNRSRLWIAEDVRQVLERDTVRSNTLIFLFDAYSFNIKFLNVYCIFY